MLFFNALKIGLQDSLLLSPFIEQSALFCIFSTFIFSISSTHKNYTIPR